MSLIWWHIFAAVATQRLRVSRPLEHPALQNLQNPAMSLIVMRLVMHNCCALRMHILDGTLELAFGWFNLNLFPVPGKPTLNSDAVNPGFLLMGRKCGLLMGLLTGMVTHNHFSIARCASSANPNRQKAKIG